MLFDGLYFDIKTMKRDEGGGKRDEGKRNEEHNHSLPMPVIYCIVPEGVRFMYNPSLVVRYCPKTAGWQAAL